MHVQLVDPPPQSPESISRDLEANLYPDLVRRFPGIEISRGEAAEEADEIMAGLKRNTLIALAVIYALLAVSFRSYAQAFLFLLAVPVAWLGGVLAHWALGLNLSFQSLVGMVAASGVVVNDSVVLLDYIKQRRTRYEAAGRRLEVGESVADRDLGPTASSLQPPASSLQPPASVLIIEACSSRFRQIFLVSLTNLAGFFPMLLSRCTDFSPATSDVLRSLRTWSKISICVSIPCRPSPMPNRPAPGCFGWPRTSLGTTRSFAATATSCLRQHGSGERSMPLRGPRTSCSGLSRSALCKQLSPSSRTNARRSFASAGWRGSHPQRSQSSLRAWWKNM